MLNKEAEMNIIVTEFFKRSKIQQTADTKAVMEFLTTPESINKMILMAELGLPSLNGVVAELEEKFGNSETFPLNHEGEGQNVTNRQNVGRMVKYIMREFGYYPVDGGLSERARLRDFANSKYFSTAAVYQRIAESPRFKIVVNVIPSAKES